MRSTFQRWTAVFMAAAGLCMAASPSAACVGDCNGNARVTIEELIRGVSISLETESIETCDAIDNNRDGMVGVNELIRGVNKSLSGCGFGAPGDVLISTQGDELDEYDVGSGASLTAVPSSHARVTGQACLLPGASGNYAVGEITGWPEQAPGWGIFSPDGTFLQKLPLPALEGEPPSVPVGCAADAQGRIFGSSVGLLCAGQLIVFFPPDYTQSCIVDNGLCDGGTMALDDGGDLYVATQSGVLRYAGPFPTSPAECASVAPIPTLFIDNPDDVFALGVARGPDGHWFVSQRGEPSVSAAAIQEYDAGGGFIRDLLPSGSWGNPAGLAFDARGSLYYADRGLDLVGAPVDGAATVRKIAFAEDGTPAEPELIASRLTHADGVAVFPSRADEWLTLGGSYRRTYFNPRERQLTAATAPNLVVKWRYLTGGMISAQSAVTWIDIPGEGLTQVVIVSSWDRSVYALRAENGSRVWSYLRKPQPGTFYPFAGSPTVAWVDGQQRVYVPGGETMYCLDATTGAEIWQFDAGTGCTTDCTPQRERNQIESTPAIANGLVIVGMDINDSPPGKGGVLALRAGDGRLAWWFDLETEETCRPSPEDNIRRFDGYHGEAELGLPEGFLATRPGCDFDRASTACGNVWSSAAVDFRRGLFYIASSNCDTDDNPSTAPPPPPMPPYDEAIFAVTFDGDPAWVWRPREVDNDDLSFGAVPNLFEANIQGEVREVVGIGGKDGTYYVLDRDGTNEVTGVIEPYWQTNVVPGGPAGGMIGAASVGENRIAVCTAPGFSVFNPQKPSVHTFDAGTGEVVWQYSNTDPCFGPTMGVPGLVFTGGTPRPNVNVFDREDGRLVRSLAGTTVISGLASGPTIVGGNIFVGGGTGAFNEGSDAEAQALQDTPLSALCAQGAPGCTPNTCTDDDTCTYDYRNRAGTCVSEPSAEGIECSIGGVEGACQAGTCVAVAG